MGFFDVNAAIGRVPNSRKGFDTAEALLAEMDRLGITEALVHHRLAEDADIMKGNAALMEAIRGQDRLHACWVMAPSALGDLPGMEEWVKDAADAGVKAVRIFPRHSLYTLSDWCVGTLCATLERIEMPLLIDYGPHMWPERVIPWESIKALCEQYPSLPLIVTGITPGETRDVCALLPQVKNLYLEYHAFCTANGLELMAAAGFGEAMLFGTGLPLRAGECPVEQTLRGSLEPEDLLDVSCNNARRILSLPDDAAPMEAKPFPLPPKVIDAHAHIGAWERTCTPVRTLDDIIASMDWCHIDKMAVCSFTAIHGETHVGNCETAAALRHAPGRLYGYAVINPHYPEEAADELQYCFERSQGFIGIKLHCALHEAQVQHPGYSYALGFANERGLPVLVHRGGEDHWDEVTAHYPRANFIMAHGCLWDGIAPQGRDLYARVRTTPNLYVDVAGSASHREALARLVDVAGADKVLFGSDFPMFDFGFELGRITGSGLDSAAQQAMLFDNARKLFSFM